MNRESNSEYHCPGCQCYLQNESIGNSPKNYQDVFFDKWDKIVEKDNRICNKCGIKKHKIYMDELANGMFICSLQTQCEQRHS